MLDRRLRRHRPTVFRTLHLTYSRVLPRLDGVAAAVTLAMRDGGCKA